MRSLLAKSGLGASNVAAIGVATHRSSAVAVHPRTGRALTPLVLWNDHRDAAETAQLRASRAAGPILTESGLPILPYFFAPRVLWMRRHFAAARRARFVTADAWLLSRLSDRAEPVTDPTIAARTLLARRKDGEWSPRLRSLAGLARVPLAEILDSVAPRGRAPGKIPIRASVADQSAAFLGLAAPSDDATTLVFGTGLFVAAAGDRAWAPGERRGVIPTMLARVGGKVVAGREANDPSSGASLSAFARLLFDAKAAKDPSALDRLARRADPDEAARLFVLPAAAGLGAPWLLPAQRAALLGVGHGTSKAAVARAVIDGVAMRAAELLELLDAGPVVIAAGGGAQSDLLLQSTADFSGREIRRAEVGEATARGAALLAGIGAGLIAGFDDPRVANRTARAFRPRTTREERTALRRRAFQTVRALTRMPG